MTHVTRHGTELEMHFTHDIPVHSPNFFIASCRTVSKMNEFAITNLIIQPDTTLICRHLNDCPLLKQAREGKPPNGRHLAIYRHSAPTYAPPPRFWRHPIPGARFVVPVAEAETHPDLPRNRTVLVYVHGFRQRYWQVVGCGMHLLTRINGLRAVTEEGGVAVVGFLWPSHRRNYLLARAKSERAGKMLRETLNLLLSLGNTVHIFAHSLGCRVVMHALTDFTPTTIPAPAPISSIPPPTFPTTPPNSLPSLQNLPGTVSSIDSVFLSAPAIPVNALSQTGDFPATRIACKRIIVFHSSNDELLSSFFRLGEILPGIGQLSPITGTTALGLRGFADQPVPVKCVAFDVTQSVHSHHTHQWILSAEVMQVMIPVLSGRPGEMDFVSETELEDDWEADSDTDDVGNGDD